MQADTVATLPPNFDNFNGRRAQWADDALTSFERQRCDEGEHLQNLADLLCDFGHWCDRNGLQLAEALKIAATQYGGETEGKGLQFSAAVQ